MKGLRTWIFASLGTALATACGSVPTNLMCVICDTGSNDAGDDGTNSGATEGGATAPESGVLDTGALDREAGPPPQDGRADGG
jgi:hypothetical protein